MSLAYPFIFPECYVDTNLIEHLIHGSVNHQHSCNKVVGTLRGRFRDRFAIGIVDLDKKPVGYLEECETIASSTHLRILKHRQKPHYMITINPAVDQFLLDCAVEQNISPEAFGFPSKLEEFISRTKTATSNKDQNIRRLIVAISGNKELCLMQNTLMYLKANTYSSSPNAIKEIWSQPS